MTENNRSIETDFNNELQMPESAKESPKTEDDFEQHKDDPEEDSSTLKFVLAILGMGKPVPGSWRIFHKINRWSAWKMQQAIGGDAIANIRHPNGKEDLLPAKYVRGGEDEKELTGWKVAGMGSKRYDPGVRGGDSTRFGRADMIHINEDDLEQGTWTEATMSAAISTNREQYLFRDAKLTATIDVTGVEEPGSLDLPGRPVSNESGGDAVADGGYAARLLDIDIQRPGICEDILVPLNSRTGYDGQIVSMARYSTMKNEKADQEQLRDAKNSGWAAAKLDDIEKTDLLKWVLILGAIGAILLFHAEIGQAIASLGGGNSVGETASGATGLGMIPMIGRVRGD